MWLRREIATKSCDGTQLVRAFGILWVHALPVRVEFEVSAWSATSSVVSLRPLALHSVAATSGFRAVSLSALGKIANALVLNTAASVVPSADTVETPRQPAPVESLTLNVQTRPLVFSDPRANLVTT
jgi:hypothetical protein